VSSLDPDLSFFSVETLCKQDNDFGSMESPFLVEEIDDIFKNMPNDKSPGPDGFNGVFLNKCWPEVKQ
jgi:hypothetical protein